VSLRALDPLRLTPCGELDLVTLCALLYNFGAPSAAYLSGNISRWPLFGFLHQSLIYTFLAFHSSPAMRQPEMSHSPAYYQDNDQLVTAYLQDVQTPATLPAAIHLPTKSSSSRQSLTQKSVADVAPSDLRSMHDFGSYATPDTTNTSNDHHRHSQGLRKLEDYNQVPVGFVYPVSEQLVVTPVAFVAP
jgi:hypothetical protein